MFYKLTAVAGTYGPLPIHGREQGRKILVEGHIRYRTWGEEQGKDSLQSEGIRAYTQSCMYGRMPYGRHQG